MPAAHLIDSAAAAVCRPRFLGVMWCCGDGRTDGLSGEHWDDGNGIVITGFLDSLPHVGADLWIDRTNAVLLHGSTTSRAGATRPLPSVCSIHTSIDRMRAHAWWCVGRHIFVACSNKTTSSKGWLGTPRARQTYSYGRINLSIYRSIDLSIMSNRWRYSVNGRESKRQEVE
jgi:hypothetical protein